MLNTLENKLFTTNDYEYDDKPCVSYSWKGKYNKTFNDETNLLNSSREYITNKLNSNDKLTDKNNNIEIHNALNSFYIDLDYLTNIQDNKRQNAFNAYLASKYINSFNTIMSKKYTNVKYYWFTFLCSTFVKDNDKFKGGVHILIFCSENFTRDERLELYEMIDKNVKQESKIWSTITANVVNTNTLFDIAPIKSCNILFPFAQKDKNKRQYVYVDKLSKYNGENWFVLNSTQTKPLDTTNISLINNDIDDYIDAMNLDNILSENDDENNELTQSEQQENTTSENIIDNNNEIIQDSQQECEQNEEHGQLFIIRDDIKIYANNLLCMKSLKLYEFVSSFKYLSVNHLFWSILLGTDKDGHDKYYYEFVKPYYTTLVLLNMLSCENTNEFNRYRKLGKNIKPKDITYDILELVARQMASLALTTNKFTKGEKLSGRFSYSEQLINMNSMVRSKFYRKWFVKQRCENLNNDLFSTYANTYYTMKLLDNKIDKTFIKEHGLSQLDVRTITNMMTKIRYTAKTTIDSFIKIITMFCEGITTEIEPFTRFRSYTHQTCYVNDNDEQLIEDENTNEEIVSFCHVDPKFNVDEQNNIIDKTYEQVIKLWFSICLTFNFISSNFQLQPAIKNTIGAFIKNYISVDITGATQRRDKYKNILIYNVRQTIELEKYPYNQWIPDRGGNILLDVWATKLYQHYIVDCLTQEFNDNKIYGFIKLFVENSIYAERVLGSIKVLPHADKDLNEMLNNIIKTHPTESWNAPSEIDIEKANIFPMRNGWLEFYWKSDEKPYVIKFSYNNRDKYTESHTNIPWVGDLNVYLNWINQSENKEAKQAYERVCEMVKQIYPIKEELEYNMSLFSSVLYGNDEKNMIHVMYGTGADGKTTITTAIFSMLDSEGFTNDVYITEHGRKIQLEPLEGLGSTMKADTLLVTTSKAGGHDEGGRACMIHKRFISVAEPDQHLSGGNLNGAAIKEITGGGAIQARKIFKGAVSVQANSFITFQTNDFPGTDDTSKGFRRRLSVYQHLSKFKTDEELNDISSDNIEYKFRADNTLNENLIKNIYYKQAMFYYLLPFAIRNIENNWRSLQKIPKPQSVLDSINKVLTKASGITKWFTENIEECTTFVDKLGNKQLPIINIKSMLDKMVKSNRESRDDRLWRGFKDTNEEQKHIIRAIQNYFEQEIFKLQDKYYIHNDKSTVINTSDKQLVNFINATQIEPNKASLNVFDDLSKLQGIFLSKFAVSSATKSEVSDYGDLFLVGYKMINLKELQKQTQQVITNDDDMNGYIDE